MLLYRIVALFLSLLAVLGVVRALPEDVMSYSDRELAFLDEYLSFSHGATVTLYAEKDSKEPLLTAQTDGPCDLPEGAFDCGAGFVKAVTWIAFDVTGNHRLRVRGASGARITVSYNELETKAYSVFTVFKKNVFYKIDLSYHLIEGTVPSFETDGAYRCSVAYPSFGGVPSEPLEPLADIHLRDPYIMLDKDGFYYMTGTYDPKEWSNTREIHVYRSDDMTHWTDLGAVWVYDRDAVWQKDLLTDGTSPVWAPELHFINGDYWICYSLGWGAMNGGVLKSTTGRPEGPYIDVARKPIFDYIDSSFFVDDDGSVYAVWSDGQYAKMKKDMTGFLTVKGTLRSESGQPVGFEGCSILKHNGLYYLCSSSYTVHYRDDGSSYLSYDSYYAVSNRLAGPYSERRLLLINGGHNNLFLGKDGKLYTTAFSGSTLNERPAVKQIDIADNGLLYVK